VALRRQRLGDLSRGLPRGEAVLAQAQQRLDFLGDRLPRSLRSLAERRRVQLADLRIGTGVLTRAVRDGRRRVEEAERSLGPALGRAARDARRVLDDLGGRLDRAQVARIQRRRDVLARVTPRLDPVARRAVAESAEDFARVVAGFTPALPLGRIGRLREGLLALDRLRETLGYEETLRRGFAVVWSDGHTVTTAEAAAKATSLDIQFADGRHVVGQRPALKRKAPEAPPEQGSLL
jgi:exodeoxyribonuclease VII large subunit